jgi:hypothetical protein
MFRPSVDHIIWSNWTFLDHLETLFGPYRLDHVWTLCGPCRVRGSGRAAGETTRDVGGEGGP